MSILESIRAMFDVPSRRRDLDCSADIGTSARTGVFLLFRDLRQGGGFFDNTGPDEDWMRDVVRELGHLHHGFASAINREDSFVALIEYLEVGSSSPTEFFLDFLEVSLRNWRAPRWNNDLVDAINGVLEEYDSPYLLTRYSYQTTDSTTEIRTTPRAYLKQDSIVQQHAIEPALELFSDPAYETPADDFRKALRKHRTGDYDGCVTSCAAAVEGTIKTLAAKNGWRIRAMDWTPWRNPSSANRRCQIRPEHRFARLPIGATPSRIPTVTSANTTLPNTLLGTSSPWPHR